MIKTSKKDTYKEAEIKARNMAHKYACNAFVIKYKGVGYFAVDEVTKAILNGKDVDVIFNTVNG